MSDSNFGSEIICYQHCQKRAKVFCFNTSQYCTFCKEHMLHDAICIPSPFKNASKEFNSVVIKPTTGDFLNTYKNSSNLHIGITNSAGKVYEYDYNGKSLSNGEKWNQCISINLFNPDKDLDSHWNRVLTKVYEDNCWTSERYDCDKYNCYTFVLSFLTELQREDLNPYIKDKYSFCHHFVVPKTRKAAKYISLFRRLKKESVIIQEQDRLSST